MRHAHLNSSLPRGGGQRATPLPITTPPLPLNGLSNPSHGHIRVNDASQYDPINLPNRRNTRLMVKKTNTQLFQLALCPR